MAITFGETSKLEDETQSSDLIKACKYPSNQATKIQAICIYLKDSPSHGNDVKVKCALYDTNRNFIAETEEKTLGQAQDGWVFFRFTMPPAVTASTNYLLTWWTDSLIKDYRTTATAQTNADEEGYNGWPNPLSENWVNYRYSIYALGITQPSISDTVTVTDAVADIIVDNTRRISVYDSTSLSESVDIIVFSILVNDSIAVSEGVTLSMPCINVQEWINLTLTSYISVNDSVSVNESATPLVSFYLLSVNDATSLTESVAMLIPFYLVSVNDSATVAEAVTAPMLFCFVSVNDATSLAEAITSVATLYDISITEVISIFDKAYLDFWMQRTKETDVWTERTKETDVWTERTKETDVWTERVNKETA